MKNKALYDEYAITYWPCHFFTMKARDKYNQMISAICERAPEGVKDISLCQKIRRWFCIRYLNCMDLIWFKKQ